MAFKYHVVEGKNPKTGAAIFFAMADPVNTGNLRGSEPRMHRLFTVHSFTVYSFPNLHS